MEIRTLKSGSLRFDLVHSFILIQDLCSQPVIHVSISVLK